MSIQVYECRDHGRTEVFLRGLDVPQTHTCPGCGKPIPHVISAPALVDVQHDWNDKASDQQRNPYDQAKAQLNNMANVQEAAKHIDNEQKTRAVRPTPQQKQVAFARKKTKQT